jgi:hypothetical protein
VDEAPDERAIVDRIRERLRRSDARAPLAKRPLPPSAPEDVEAELAVLGAAQDVYDLPLRSERPVLAPVARVANTVLRKLLKPTFERQVSYNSANHRLVQALQQQLAEVARRCDALQAEVDELRKALARR